MTGSRIKFIFWRSLPPLISNGSVSFKISMMEQRDKTVFHNTTPDLQDQDRFFWSQTGLVLRPMVWDHITRMWDGRAHMPRDWLLITAVTQVIKDQIAVTRRSNRTASLTAWQQHQQQRHWQRYHSALNLLVQPLDALSLGFCLSGTHRGCVGLKIAK